MARQPDRDDVASAIEATNRFRLLRALHAGPACAPPLGAEQICRAAIIDRETTGIDTECGEIIDLASTVFEYRWSPAVPKAWWGETPANEAIAETIYLRDGIYKTMQRQPKLRSLRRPTATSAEENQRAIRARLICHGHSAEKNFADECRNPIPPTD